MKILIYLLLIVSISTNIFAGNDDLPEKKKNAVIVKFDLKQQIDPAAKRNTNNAFNLAKEKNADAIVIVMNTPGGTLNDADSIRTKIINSKIPVYVLINPNAASAGALISIACNKIYMSQGATIGAATVVTGNAQELPDKYQSYMRAMMRSTAELRGRNPEIAEAMVGKPVPSGDTTRTKVLTLTRSEAEKAGYCDGKAETIDELLTAEGYVDYKIEELKITGIDRIINFLISPVIHGILILLILGGIYYELQSPGIGFPLAVAVTAAILFFAPLYLEKLAANWEILLFIAGLALLMVEIFVTPGFGIPGISGIILLLAGLVLSMVGNVYFDFTFVGGGEVIKSLVVVMISFVLSIVLVLTTGNKIIQSKAFQKLVLNETLKKGDYRPFSVEKTEKNESSIVGKFATTLTEMHPIGKIDCEGGNYFAITEGEFLKKGVRVIILEDNGNRILVRKDKDNNT